jgi:acyl-CoA thioesterase I
MGVLLYLLISGAILNWGLFLIAAGVVASVWRSHLGRVLAWSGLVLALVSAVPIHSAVYAVLIILVVGWQVARAGHPILQRCMAGAVLGGVTLAGAAAILDGPDPNIPLQTTEPFFVVGDSLSAGLGALAEGTWPQIISRRLKVVVHNLARAGATLADGKAQAGAIPNGPATVFVELGGNDLLGKRSATQFEADLRTLLAAVGAKDRQVLMFELPLFPLQNTFGHIQRKACREAGVVLLPRALLAGAVALSGHTSDGLHLSPAGHQWLADRIGEMSGR